jgi:hypothetical protein
MPQRPYEMIGAGRVVSSVWKRGDEAQGWTYRFNVFRMDSRNGSVSRLFRPADLFDLLKLCRLLAVELAGDGCLPACDLHRLIDIADALDSLLEELAGPAQRETGSVGRSNPSVSES